MRVDGPRLTADLESLARIGRDPAGGLNRTAFSASDTEAREWYHQRCRAAGLELRCDRFGNMVAGAPGPWDVPAVWSGSHIDTVPDGGPLDGALGTVAALECLRRITEEQVPLGHPVHAVVFADEEGNYSHLFGSYGMVHGYDDDRLCAMTGRDGDRLVEALERFAWRDGDTTMTPSPATVRSFVELHIEQGPRLESAGVPIGVVTSIVGLGGADVVFTGRADHAGTTPMTMRRDPGRAAGEFLTRLAAAAASVSDDAVATCGRISFEPGGSNVVPRAARLTLDFRAPAAEDVAALTRVLAETAEACAAGHDVECEFRPAPAVDPVPLDPDVRARIEGAAQRRGLATMSLPSGAGHDSQNLAQVVPTGVIFVPSHDGRSHSPFEHTDPDLLVQGADVLLETLLDLAR